MENNEFVPVEVEISAGIEKLCRETQLSESRTRELVSQFLPLLAEVKFAVDIVNTTKVEDESQIEAIVALGEANKVLVSARTSSSKKKDKLADDAKKEHKAIVAIYKYIVDKLAPYEVLAKEGKDFVKIQEQKRLAELEKARQERIAQRNVLLSGYDKTCADLGAEDVTDDIFNVVLKGLKDEEEARIKAEQEAAAEALALAKAQEEERQRLAEENRKMQIQLEEERKVQQALLQRQKLGYERIQILQRFNLAPSSQAWIDKGVDFLAAMEMQEFSEIRDAIGFEHQSILRETEQKETALQAQLAEVAQKAQAVQEVTELVQASQRDELAAAIVAEILVIVQNSDGVLCGGKLKSWRETKRLYPLLVEWESR